MTTPLVDAPAPARVDPAHFRSVMGTFASGVVVISAEGTDGPVGMTCQSFFSLSIDPPLIALGVAKSSSTWPHVAAAGRFAVNILPAGAAPEALQFARSGTDKWAGIAWAPGFTGAPLIADALAGIECELDAVHDGGDHHLVVGRVVSLDQRPEVDPLVYFRGSFGAFSA